MTLYTDAGPYYDDLVAAVHEARRTIHMAYYGLAADTTGRRLAAELQARAAAGVAVHVMVDACGLFLDANSRLWRNWGLMETLQQRGVQVDLFWPRSRRLHPLNRMHCKFCAVDGRVAFVGGSNVGDHYLAWRDVNLRLTGAVGDDLVRLYGLLRQMGGHAQPRLPVPSALAVAGMPLLLTVPGRRRQIHRALLNLIRRADTAVSLRSWTFLPDRAILDALEARLAQSVRVTVMISHRTRFPPNDFLNRRVAARLARAGAAVYRYDASQMHAKVAWSSQGDVLLGSANLDLWSMNTFFECCVRLNSPALARQLDQALQADLAGCRAVRPALPPVRMPATR